MRTTVSWGTFQWLSVWVASMAAYCEASTSSYRARCSPLNLPFTGKVRVMSEA